MAEGLRKGPCLSTGTEDSGPESWTRWGLSKWSQESRSLPEMNTPGKNTRASVTRGDLIIRAHSGPKVKCTGREGLAAQAHCAHYNNSRGRHQGVTEVPHNMRKISLQSNTLVRKRKPYRKETTTPSSTGRDVYRPAFSSDVTLGVTGLRPPSPSLSGATTKPTPFCTEVTC